VSTKTAQLQIRVTPAEKAALVREARRAGCDVSALVLARALPQADERLRQAVRALRHAADPRYLLADIHDLLANAASFEFPALVADLPVHALDPWLQNYVAAMVELAAAQQGTPPPAWTRDVVPLGEPYFASELRSLRQHLLTVAPVPFKRRNLFVDASIGARV
jgi:uncharacterized protein (DUF1778 family)